MSLVAEHLKRARGLVEQGWGRARYRTSYQNAEDSYAVCFCAAGAIRAVELDDPLDTGISLPHWMRGDTMSAMDFLAHVVAGPGPYKFREDYVTRWNDIEGRTKEEVLLAFDDAIALAGVEA